MPRMSQTGPMGRGSFVEPIRNDPHVRAIADHMYALLQVGQRMWENGFPTDHVERESDALKKDLDAALRRFLRQSGRGMYTSPIKGYDHYHGKDSKSRGSA